MSAFDICYLFFDIGIEVVFVGCFNVGKFSVLNMLINQKSLVCILKILGCIQFINLFEVVDGKCLVDLFGYGYVEVLEEMKCKWQCVFGEYFEKCQSL